MGDFSKLKETCLCAAVLTTDSDIVTGNRHTDCFAKIKEQGKRPIASSFAQGFYTTDLRYVTREVGYMLQIAAGIESVAKGGYRGNRLYSEDLY